MLRKFKNMDGLSVAEKDLLRPDRFWELARILQTAMPPLPDPFTDEKINKLTTADAEDAWVMEVSAMVPFCHKESCVGLSFAHCQSGQDCPSDQKNRRKGR